MPSTDSTMQPISAPILVPGTQQEPTMPSLPTPIDINAANSASGTGNISPTAMSNPRTSLSNTRALTYNGGNISPSSPGFGNNTSSGLGRFPSIGNTKKLTIENMTLKAKITELERYVTGLKGELILFTQKSHTLRSEIKEAEDLHTTETHKLEEHIKKCEFELGAKVVECEALHAQLIENARAHQQLLQHLQQQEQKQAQHEQQDEQSTDVKDQEENVSEPTPGELERDERIKTLMEENTRKDAMISELLEKVDRLGTEVLNLEREKAHLERPSSPSPADFTAAKLDDTTTTETAPPAAASLKDLVPITAEAIIAATTPSASVQNLAIQTHAKEVSGSQSDSSLNTSTSTSPSTIQSEDEEGVPMHGNSIATTSVNSVGYDVSLEHPKLLAKFQALRIQHAQTSEYLGFLESENLELKVQLLDVSSGFDTAAAR
ncbi:hypothetical protein BGX26_003239 [Mortierella sp. AD094]|nr:hypothetical protein BGX26_003239 [Mortierella sp. AD094]